MPIYEYQCTACGHTLESIQKFSDAPLTDCPACHKSGLKKLLSAPAFRLNGAGWYETDFKTGKKKNLTGDSTSTSSADSTGSVSTPAPPPTAASAPSTNTSPAV
ncbi:MAG TPA: zinc ribbon domain-containing protein [Pseudomonadales bacterium]|nr:zinc ribbon domain-containing protein [Pseudomonadales bacterium]